MERDCYTFFEFNDDILKYEEQPLLVKNPSSKKLLSPDCLVTFKPELNRYPLLVEIKCLEDIEDKEKGPDIKHKVSVLKEFAASNGLEFKLILDVDIRGQHLDNLKFLYRFMGAPQLFNRYQDPIMTMIKAKKSISVTGLLDILAKEKVDRALMLPSIWHLVSRKTIKVDLTKPLTNSTILEDN